MSRTRSIQAIQRKQVAILTGRSVHEVEKVYGRTQEYFVRGAQLKVEDLEFAKKVGITHIYAYDESQVPGDQHPALAFIFKSPSPSLVDVLFGRGASKRENMSPAEKEKKDLRGPKHPRSRRSRK